MGLRSGQPKRLARLGERWDRCLYSLRSFPSLASGLSRESCSAEAWALRSKPGTKPVIAVWNQVGELVLTAPMPCMPVAFWNDPDGSRLRQAYFQHFPGVWRHGDWIEIDPETGQCLIYGRSDSTLNRGGVRMGTSEFYQVVESLPEILGSLVIDTTGLGRRWQGNTRETAFVYRAAGNRRVR